ncbi:MAG TPA: cupin domain-containing protein [Thermomicrobiales bacterium]|nr:cupin domain-containing protein [Thermomicrobiales bacterium]
MTRKRLVTGVDSHGRSVIVNDGPWPGQWDRGENDYDDYLWVITRIPAPLDVTETTSDGIVRLVPSGDEVVVRVVTLQPQAVLARLSDAEIEARHSRRDYAEMEELPDRPNMHSTPTLDVIVVLSGEVDLELDSGQVAHLKPGDSVVQRGTAHAWRVTGDVPCVMTGVTVRGATEAPGVATTDPAAAHVDTNGVENC